MPIARGGGAAVVFNNKLHFFNGASFDGGFKKDHTDHWSLDLTNVAAGWTTLAGNSLGRNHLGGAVHGDKIYAVGGQFLEDEGCSNQKLVESYDSKTNKWTKLADLPVGTGHISPSTLSTKYGIVVIGGAVNTPGKGCAPPGNHRNQAFFYNPGTNKWQDIFNPIAGASMVSGIVGNTVYAQDGKGVQAIHLQFLSGKAKVGMAVQEEESLAVGGGGSSAAALPVAGIVVAAVAVALLALVAAVYVAARRRSIDTSTGSIEVGQDSSVVRNRVIIEV